MTRLRVEKLNHVNPVLRDFAGANEFYAEVYGAIEYMNSYDQEQDRDASLFLIGDTCIELFSPRGRVNCIMAGPFLTDVSKAWDLEAFRARAAENFAVGRGGRPEEIVGAALYFASDASSFTTGSILAVDGGCENLHEPRTGMCQAAAGTGFASCSRCGYCSSTTRVSSQAAVNESAVAPASSHEIAPSPYRSDPAEISPSITMR